MILRSTLLLIMHSSNEKEVNEFYFSQHNSTFYLYWCMFSNVMILLHMLLDPNCSTCVNYLFLNLKLEQSLISVTFFFFHFSGKNVVLPMFVMIN